MMYLVLTALLALNVSKEVLDAFITVKNGISESNDVLNNSTNRIYDNLKKKSTDPKEGPVAKPWYDKATQVRKLADELYDEIETIKEDIIKQSGGLDEETKQIKSKDDIDTGTRILVEEKKGVALQKKINEYRSKFLALIDKPDERAKVETSLTLRAEDPKGAEAKGEGVRDWAAATFHHVPVVGTVAILTKIQNDVKATENRMVEYMFNQIGATDFKFDKLSAAVIAPKSYLGAGKEYTAEIFLAASSSQAAADVYLGSLNMALFKADSSGGMVWNTPDDSKTPFNGTPEKLENKGGKGQYKTTASGVGERKYEGAIKIKNPKGGYDWYAFQQSYEVAPAGGFAVSPTKMNVLYIGVDNPISISASAAKSDNDISASLSGGGSISRAGKDGWIARVTTPGEATVNVSGKTMDGDNKSFGSVKFRVKRIPDPKATLGGNVNLTSKIQKGTLLSQGGIVAVLEGFDFECRFNVTEYTLIFAPSGQDVVNKVIQGPVITPDVKTILSRVKAKDIVVFDNIKAVGCDGTPRKLGSLAFTII